MADLQAQTSDLFCASDADLTISSSDGVLFKVHRKNLEVHSDIFADASAATRQEADSEIVHLSETSDVLDLLFQYMYRQLPPDLEQVDFKACCGLAEAAEKYLVFSALAWCRIKMKYLRAWTPKHPLEVLDYGLRHGHVDIADEAARRSMSCGVGKAMEILPPQVFRRWILFYERWKKQTALHLAELDEHGDDEDKLLRKCLADPNPYYTYKQKLKGYTPDELQSMMNMKFTEL